MILHREKNLTIIVRTLVLAFTRTLASVAGFVLAILVKKSYILSRVPFMLKKY